MRQEVIAEVSLDLDFARENLNTLIALFRWGSNKLIWDNKQVALTAADSIIKTMVELRGTVGNDDGKAS
jgi:hypothetical protein